MSECSVFVKTPVHDGLSTAPIEFRIVQQLKREDEAFASGSAVRCATTWLTLVLPDRLLYTQFYTGTTFYRIEVNIPKHL